MNINFLMSVGALGLDLMLHNLKSNVTVSFSVNH